MIDMTPPTDVRGQNLGPYQIRDELGGGGMSVVYRAWDPKLGREVAIKVLARQFTRDENYIKRFEQEAAVLAQLRHAHIVPLFDYGADRGYPYLVMPLVEGGMLAEEMRGRILPLRRVREVITQLGSALDYAHSRQVIHRDIKPANVLIDEQGNCLLSDFGVAKILAGPAQVLTGTGTPGTPGYMSPEQLRGDPIDARSDIYSLGVMLYQMTTGHLPFEADTPYGGALKALQTPPPSPQLLNEDLPDGVERVILKALEKDPDQRYATAGALVRALHKAIPDAPDPGTGSDTEVRTGDSGRRGTRLIRFLAAGAVLLLAAILLLSWQAGSGGRASPTPSLAPNVISAITQPSPSAAPAASATPTPTSTATPAPTPTPTVTASPTPTPTPTSCPDSSPYRLGAEEMAQLDCPSQNFVPSRNIVLQRFENGVMIIFARTDNVFDSRGGSLIYVLSRDGRAWRVVDRWVETSARSDDWYTCERRPGQTPIESGIPWRGFGKAWCDYPEVRAALGRVLSVEESSTAAFQSYNKGRAFQIQDWKDFEGWSASTVYGVYWPETAGNVLTGTWRPK